MSDLEKKKQDQLDRLKWLKKTLQKDYDNETNKIKDQIDQNLQSWCDALITEILLFKISNQQISFDLSYLANDSIYLKEIDINDFIKIKDYDPSRLKTNNSAEFDNYIFNKIKQNQPAYEYLIEKLNSNLSYFGLKIFNDKICINFLST